MRGLEAPKFLKVSAFLRLTQGTLSAGEDLGAGLADRAHEVALRHDARDLAAISLDDDAVNPMLRDRRAM